MTFPSDSSMFDEELLWVKNYFEKWSHCKRAIAVCTMLKQFQHPTLRFIHSKIEATFAQSIECDKNKQMEQKSNDKTYIYELCDSYKSLTNTNDVQLNNKDSIFFESDKLIMGDNSSSNSLNSCTTNNNNNNYSHNNANNPNTNIHLVGDKFRTKEEILTEIFNCILMLKIGNDDVIQEYLALIPFMVDDTHRHNINVGVVMQTLSILVAHPALSPDDMRTVKEHIDRLKCIIHVQNGQSQNSDWQAIAPPYVFKPPTNNIFSSLSPVGSSLIQSDNLYDTQSDFMETEVGSAGRSSNNLSDEYGGFIANDDQNVSFSKNGTEIPDFNPDLDASQFLKNLNSSISLNTALKTRRSNSLTTGGIKHNQFLSAVLTSSTENLLHLQKPRSYSLSIENPRLHMTASGSETRLDDLKPTFQTFQTQNPGMKYVFPWLKRLRLHKYYSIFESFTYEQMMEITDEFLEKLNVTQGARTKIMNSIQKLKERHTRLTQAERDLKTNEITINAAIEILTEVVGTPMKPIDIYNPMDVAAQFLNVLSFVCNIIARKQLVPQDEEAIAQLIRIFDIAQLENNEPFLSNTCDLRNWRYNIETKRLEFPPNGHYHKNVSGSAKGNTNKSKWSSSTKLHNKNTIENKSHRKNVNTTSNFNFVTMSQVQKPTKQHLSTKSKQSLPRQTRQSEFNNNYQQTPNNSYNKSASHPNFSSNNMSNGQQYVNLSNQNLNPQLHNSYHRHSVSNLITITPAKTTVTITPTAPNHQKVSSCVGLHSSQSTPHSTINISNLGNRTTPIMTSVLSQLAYNTSTGTIGRSSSTDGGNYAKQSSNKTILGDISPYRDLEFLSLQMTEQAIN